MIFLKIHHDSVNTSYLVKNQVYHDHIKKIDVRFHFVHKIPNEGDIELKKISTKGNLADILTKVAIGTNFNHCKKVIEITLYL